MKRSKNSSIPLLEFDEHFRTQGFNLIVGVDEAGRGPLAGPVVAAAVIWERNIEVDQIGDSKKLTPSKREFLFREILARALAVGIGYVTPQEIDSTNILTASLKAMEIAIKNLKIKPDLVLIDGPYRLSLNIAQYGIPKGDAKSFAIGSASIVAKVFRDRLMNYYHRIYPLYGFNTNKGYPTTHHIRALMDFGPSPIHRKSFISHLSKQ